MSEIRVNKLVNEAGTGAIELTEGGTIPSGKTISGSGTIAVNSSGTAAGLSGTPDITVGTVNGSTATFSGSVSIGGTLTYQDVTNIDSVGVITARAGADLNGYKVEGGNLDTSTGLNGEFDFLLENGHIQSYSSATAGNYQPDFKVSATKSLNSIMDVGDIITCTLMVASSSHYLTTASIKIDDSSSNLDIDNVGGSAPSAANGSGYDIYSFTIQKTAATPAYHIIVNTLGAA